MSGILGWFGGLLSVAGAIAAFVPGGQLVGLGLVLAGAGLNALDRTGGTPPAADQGTQREMVLDPAAHIPVVYGRTIVGPRLVYVTQSGASFEKLYLVGVLCEGPISAIEEIYLDGNCAVLSDGTVRGEVTSAKTVSALDLLTPCQVHCTGHGFGTGESVRVVAGSVDGDYYVTAIDANHFTIPTTATSSGTGSALRLNPGYMKQDTDGHDTTTPLVRFAKYLGSDAQTSAANPGDANGPTADSTMAVHDVPGWAGALSGLAYLVLELLYDKDARWPNGVPEVTVMVKGRTVYDPRSAATAWSDNPILCYRDYLSDGARYGASAGAVRYGLGIAAADLDDGTHGTGLHALADYCDGIVSCPAGTGLTAVSATTGSNERLTTAKAHGLATNDVVWVRGVSATPALADGEYVVASTPSGTTLTLTGVTFSGDGGAGGTVQKCTTQKRYSCNGALDTGRTLQENLNAILSSCRAFPTQEGGRWSAVLTRAGLTPSSFALDVTTILGDWEFATPDSGDVPNLVLATFAPRFGDTETVEWPPTTITNPYLEDDAYVPNVRELELPMTQDYYQAQRVARCALEEARNKLVVALTATEAALALSVGDLVNVSHETPAWTAKTFWVIGLGINPDATVRLLLMEYLATAYDEQLTDDAPGQGTALPLPWYVAPPTGLLLTTGTGEQRIKVTWTASTDALAWRYEVEARRSDEGTWRGFGFWDAATLAAIIAPVADGEVWAVRVRAVRRVGTASAWLEASHTVGLIGASVFTVTVTADAAGVDYALTFGVNCATVELYSIQNVASGAANPPTDIVYRSARIERPASGTVTQRIATTADYYRRTRILSYNAAGLLGQENAVVETRAVVAGSGPTAAPTTLAEASDGPDHLDISWSNNGDSGSASRIYVDGAVIHTAAAAATTYTISGLQPGTTYQVDVDHFKGGQASAKNGAVAMATAAATLDAPTDFYATGRSNGPPHLSLTWAMGANAVGAQTVIEESQDGTFTDALEVSDASPTPPGATSAASALHEPYASRTFRAKHTRAGSSDSGWSATDGATYGSEIDQ